MTDYPPDVLEAMRRGAKPCDVCLGRKGYWHLCLPDFRGDPEAICWTPCERCKGTGLKEQAQ